MVLFRGTLPSTLRESFPSWQSESKITRPQHLHSTYRFAVSGPPNNFNNKKQQQKNNKNFNRTFIPLFTVHNTTDIITCTSVGHSLHLLLSFLDFVWIQLLCLVLYTHTTYNYIYTFACKHMNNHIYSTLFKTQERKSDRRSKEIEQRKEPQNAHTQRKQQGHVTLSTELQFTSLMLNFLAASTA